MKDTVVKNEINEVKTPQMKLKDVNSKEQAQEILTHLVDSDVVMTSKK